MPVSKMLEQVENEPYEPLFWGKNQSGMQAQEELTGSELRSAKWQLRCARNYALHYAKGLMKVGLHKQDANRVLEPYSWTKQILTGTEWNNFFALRTHKDAHPAMQRIARLMYLAYRKSKPIELDYDQWHLPYITDEDRCYWSDDDDLLLISVARCARVSYWNHEGKKEYAKDHELYHKLLADPVIKHMSPFGHQARPLHADEIAAYPKWRSNLSGFLQYRKLIPRENITEFNPSEEEIASWGLNQ